jgi:hypothetical protein
MPRHLAGAPATIADRPGSSDAATFAPPHPDAHHDEMAQLAGLASKAPAAPETESAAPEETASGTTAELPAAPPTYPESTLGWTFEYSALPPLGKSAADARTDSADAAYVADEASYLADEGAGPAAHRPDDSPYRAERTSPSMATAPSPRDAGAADELTDLVARRLESVAWRVRQGELALASVRADMSDEAILVATLAALLGVAG